MRILFVVLLFIVSQGLPAAKAYKWVDADGRVHYGDDSSRGEPVDLPALSTYSPPPAPQLEEGPGDEGEVIFESADESVVSLQKKVPYRSLTISSPTDDEAIVSNEGRIDVIVDVQPALQPGHMLKLYVDGKAHGKPQPSNVFSLQGLERGTHQLSVRLLDERRIVRKKAKTITFHLVKPFIRKQAR